MVCIQTRVNRRISRERSVWKVLSVKIIAYHLHVDFLDVPCLVALLEVFAAPLGRDVTPVYQRDLLAQRLGSLTALPLGPAVVSAVKNQCLFDGQDLVRVPLLGGAPDHSPCLPKLP